MRRGCISLGQVKCDNCGQVIPYPERYLAIEEKEGVEVEEGEEGKTSYYCVECALKKGYAHYKVEKGEPISWLTCYDYPTAYFQEEAGIDMILVGDSLGMTMLGYDSTLPVTMHDMIRHTQAIRRGEPTVFLVGDMPYMTYQPSVESAIRNAGRFMAEASCDAIKLEGGAEMADRIAGVRAAGIPVVGHLGLTPQSIHQLGSYGVQGKDEKLANHLKEEALILQDAGVFSIVLEKIPAKLAKEITSSLHIPTIGIGAGKDCDGQVLVTHDMLGLYEKFKPKFVRRYAELGKNTMEALVNYIDDVKNHNFPNENESY